MNDGAKQLVRVLAFVHTAALLLTSLTLSLLAQTTVGNAHGLVASVDYRQVLFPISVEIANGHSERRIPNEIISRPRELELCRRCRGRH
jgi:hypothetical protein